MGLAGARLEQMLPNAWDIPIPVSSTTIWYLLHCWKSNSRTLVWISTPGSLYLKALEIRLFKICVTFWGAPSTKPVSEGKRGKMDSGGRETTPKENR